ncbi:MAG: tetratricopeptide repeat protein [Calditrichaceae bacterium]
MKKIMTILIISQFLFGFWGCSHTSNLTKRDSDDSKISLKARDLYLKGLFYQSEGMYNEALVQFYQALHHDSTSPTIYNSIAENHISLGHYESALILLKKAKSKDPDNLETLDLMADTYFRMRDDENAIKTYKKILELNPYHEDARKYLIFLYEKNKNDLGLAEQYSELNKYYGKDIGNLYKIADIYLKYNKYDEALDAYNKILEMDSLNARTYYFIGNVYKKQNKDKQAEAAYLKALEIKPDFYSAIQDLALLYRNEQKWQQVIDVFENRNYQVDSLRMFPQMLVAESYYYLKNYDKARELILPLLEDKDAPKEIYELIARVELESKNYSAAKDYLHYLLNQERKNRIAWLFLGFTYLDMNQADSAAIVYEKALDIFPDDASLLGFYGSTLQQLERFEEAIPPLKKSLDLNPDNANAVSSLAVAYESLQMFDKCDSVYEAGIERFPENALLLNNFSYSLSERNIRLEDALKMVQKALEISPDNGAYLDTIGWIYYKLGHYNEAEKYIKQAIQMREDSAVVFEHLGDVYFELEEFNLARENWQRALDITPDNSQLKLKLEKIRNE